MSNILTPADLRRFASMAAKATTTAARVAAFVAIDAAEAEAERGQAIATFVLWGVRGDLLKAEAIARRESGAAGAAVTPAEAHEAATAAGLTVARSTVSNYLRTAATDYRTAAEVLAGLTDDTPADERPATMTRARDLLYWAEARSGIAPAAVAGGKPAASAAEAEAKAEAKAEADVKAEAKAKRDRSKVLKSYREAVAAGGRVGLCDAVRVANASPDEIRATITLLSTILADREAEAKAKAKAEKVRSKADQAKAAEAEAIAKAEAKAAEAIAKAEAEAEAIVAAAKAKAEAIVAGRKATKV